MDCLSGEIKSILFDKQENRLQVLDQTLIPKQVKYVDVEDCKDGHRVIKQMLVRGAPCIAAVGCLSLVVDLVKQFKSGYCQTESQLVDFLRTNTDYLAGSRPTAVNLKSALDFIVQQVEKNLSGEGERPTAGQLVGQLVEWCANALKRGRRSNIVLADCGALYILKLAGCYTLDDSLKDRKVNILTHCNTGALATVGHGTAYGVIKTLHSLHRLERVYFTETRPYNQGARLTAWEFVQDDIPATLIADNMVAYLMATRKIDAVIVGADRVARNGDTANKIGTLQIAVSAHYYKVPFYVATPTQSIDLSTADGSRIKVELRPENELRCIANQQLAPEQMPAWNPSFDITPARIIDGFVTELGFIPSSEFEKWIDCLPVPLAQDLVF